MRLSKLRPDANSVPLYYYHVVLPNWGSFSLIVFEIIGYPFDALKNLYDSDDLVSEEAMLGILQFTALGCP